MNDAVPQNLLSSKTVGMFESWAQTIGGILEAVNIPGFLTNLSDLYQELDEETAIWREFVAVWYQDLGTRIVGVNELYKLAVEHDLLLPVLGDRGERSQKSKLGRALAQLEGRQFAEFRIKRMPGDKRSQVRAYQLECVGDEDAMPDVDF